MLSLNARHARQAHGDVDRPLCFEIARDIHFETASGSQSRRGEGTLFFGKCTEVGGRGLLLPDRIRSRRTSAGVVRCVEVNVSGQIAGVRPRGTRVRGLLHDRLGGAKTRTALRSTYCPAKWPGIGGFIRHGCGIRRRIPRCPEWRGINKGLTQSIVVLRLRSAHPTRKPVHRYRQSERKYPLRLHWPSPFCREIEACITLRSNEPTLRCKNFEPRSASPRAHGVQGRRLWFGVAVCSGCYGAETD
jgi:hypothetical protein